MLMPRLGGHRPRHIIAIGLLLLFGIPTYVLLNNQNAEWRPNPSIPWINLGQNSSREQFSITQIPGTQNLDRPWGLIENAHRLPTADSFLTHFGAVTQIKGLSIETAKSTCQWPDGVDVNFQYGPPADWVEHDRKDEEIGKHRNEWHHFINNEMLPYETYKDRFEGRGIVIVAGNGRSVKRVKVILRQLKRLKSELPIEIHSWNHELTPESQKDIESLWPKVFFNDLSAPSNIAKSNNDNFFHVNYQLKTAAVLNSRFAEPLLLDSDNIPTIDPSSLFDSSTYREYGTLFWPDIARTRPNNPIWALTNTQCRMDEYEQESGQLIVDKRRFWYHLQLAAWFNNVHAVYYNEFLLGDKDMFRFAWHALRTKYGKPGKWVTSVGAVGQDGMYCGHSFAQYHPNGSVAFLHGGLLKTMPKLVMKWYREHGGGVFQTYKRSVVDEQHQFVERIGIKMEGAPWLPDRPDDLPAAWCTDLWDVHTRKLDEIVPGFEKVFDELGGYWILEDEDSP